MVINSGSIISCLFFPNYRTPRLKPSLQQTTKMNAKTIVAVFAIFGAFFALTQAQFLYTISVETAGGFSPTIGYMNVILKAPGMTNDVSMGSAPYSLAPGMRYDSAAQSNIPAPKLNGAVFKWNYQSGSSYNIALSSVTVIPSYLQEPFRSQFTKRFCAAGLVSSGSPRTMYQC